MSKLQKQVAQTPTSHTSVTLAPLLSSHLWLHEGSLVAN